MMASVFSFTAEASFSFELTIPKMEQKVLCCWTIIIWITRCNPFSDSWCQNENNEMNYIFDRKKRTILFIFNVRRTPWFYYPKWVLCNFLQMIFNMVPETLKPLLGVFLDSWCIWSILWLSSCVIKNLCWMVKTASSIWFSEAAMCTTYVL